MTRKSIYEYAAAVRRRYLMASKGQKAVILNEFCEASGYNRKSAIRLLRNPPKGSPAGRGRPREYGLDVLNALKSIWETADRICSKRLEPFLPELVAVLDRENELRLSPEVRAQLLRLSAASIDRLLKPFRQRGLRRPYTPGRPSTLKAQIPIRTFGEWAAVAPGSVQADLVAHCGESAGGLYLNTLVAVDVATSWTECRPVWGKGQERTGTAVHKIRQSLPFALKELHTDNGSEFLNEVLYPWCKKEGIRFTRGRPYKKNDQAYVEQKNWSVPRRLVGYDRYCSKAAYEALERLYELVRLYVNFFQPVRKLVGKERVGAKVKKRFDEAQTPYQRLLAAGVLEAEKGKALAELYGRLNPVRLRQQIDERLEALWKLAEHEGSAKSTKATSERAMEDLACG